MLNAGIDRETLLHINDEQLLVECGITNKIHRQKIQNGIKVEFDNNLLQIIKQSKYFILVCTANAFDRCEADHEQKDWIHMEIACTLSSLCQIVPVFDNFVMPEAENLPETMRAITSYNGVSWVHEYQEACVNKIVKFMGRKVPGGPLMDRFLSSSNTSSQFSYCR